MSDGFDSVTTLLEAMDKEENKGKGNFSPFWNPKNEGITNIRFLPATIGGKCIVEGEKIPWEERRVHYLNGHSILCPNQLLKDKTGKIHEPSPCPICAKAKAIYATHPERGSDEWNLAGTLRAKTRYLTRIIVRGKKEKDENGVETLAEYKPEFYEFGKKIFDMICSTVKILKADGAYPDVFDLIKGRDFILSKKGTGRNTDYSGSTFSTKEKPALDDSQLKLLVAEIKKKDYSQLNEFKSLDELKEELKTFLDDKNDEAGWETSSAASPAPAPTSAVSDDAVFGVKAETPAAAPTSEQNDIDALLASI